MHNLYDVQVVMVAMETDPVVSHTAVDGHSLTYYDAVKRHVVREAVDMTLDVLRGYAPGTYSYQHGDDDKWFNYGERYVLL